MRNVIVFNHVSLDGYFTDAQGDMSFARNDNQDPEWEAFVASNASGGSLLLFGRITYELMANFWPTPLATEQMPLVADRMNNLPKVVFSRTLNTAAWNNTRLVKSDLVGEIQRLKNTSGEDVVIFGSGTIISQLAQVGLIDEFQLVLNPVALGQGRTMFEGLKEKLTLKLIKTRAFGNGNVLLCYKPMV